MGYVGTYDRTIFYNPSNKYCIISVKTSDQSVPQQARSAYHHRDNMIRFIAVGYELPQTDKVSMILDGEYRFCRRSTPGRTSLRCSKHFCGIISDRIWN